MLSQRNQAYTQSFDKSNTFMMITIKNITWGGSNKFQDDVYKNNKTF